MFLDRVGRKSNGTDVIIGGLTMVEVVVVGGGVEVGGRGVVVVVGGGGVVAVLAVVVEEVVVVVVAVAVVVEVEVVAVVVAVVLILEPPVPNRIYPKPGVGVKGALCALCAQVIRLRVSHNQNDETRSRNSRRYLSKANIPIAVH